MQLLLWRHAEAEDPESFDEASDLKRPLTAKGRRQAERVAEWLVTRMPEPICLLVSPARRCQETVAPLLTASARRAATDKRLAPGSEAQGLLAAAGWQSTLPPSPFAERREADGATDSLVWPSPALLVSHQPMLGQLVAQLLHGSGAPGYALRKGALCWIERRERDGVFENVLRRLINPDDLS